MAQDVMARAEPPGWRAEQALIEALERLRDRMGELRDAVAAVNDHAMRTRAGAVLRTAEHVAALHLPEPKDGVVLDLEGLWRATDGWRVPAVDPDLGEVTESLRRLHYASGWLLRAVHDARRAAEEWRGGETIERQMVATDTEDARRAVAIDAGKVNAMLRRLDAVEAELQQVAREARAAPATDGAPAFVQQTGLVNLYVDKMRVKIDLARLHLTVGEQVFDLGALTSAVEAMGELTARFQGAVKAFVRRVTRVLTEGADTVGRVVLRVVQGARSLGKAAARAMDPTRRRFSFEPEMVRIEAGRFTMGIPERESKREKLDWDDNARPEHPVTIRRAFLVGKYPVTRGEYAAFAQETGREWAAPTFDQTDRHPVVHVSWEDARAYADWLSRKSGRRYRLPSETEWEYACRAGTRTARYWGNEADRRMANFDREVSGTSPVGTYPANPWGLHDMLGNVWEWVADPRHDSYDGAPDDGSVWETSGDTASRVLRGGSWNDNPRSLRAGSRLRGDPGNRDSDFGFRVARTL